MWRFTRFFSILLALIILNGCWIPEQFDAHINFNKDGSYTFYYEGILTHGFVAKVFYKERMSEKDEAGFKKEVIDDLTSKPEFKEVSYLGKGKFKVKVIKNGTIDEAYYFPLHESETKIFAILPQKDGSISVKAFLPDKKTIHDLKEMGVKIDGTLEISVASGLNVIKHNAQTTPIMFGLFGGYKWHVKSLDEEPFMNIRPAYSSNFGVIKPNINTDETDNKNNSSSLYSKSLALISEVIHKIAQLFITEKVGSKIDRDSMNEITSTQEIELYSASSVWNPVIEDETFAAWQECRNIDCITTYMKKSGASESALDFVRKSNGDGYLHAFEEKGRVDVGSVTYPIRQSNNEAYVLLNGTPSIVSTEFDLSGLDVNNNKYFLKLKSQYPKIEVWAMGARFISMNQDQNEGQKFIFSYPLLNGCRGCELLGTVKIAFEFSKDGVFTGMKTLEVLLSRPEVSLPSNSSDSSSFSSQRAIATFVHKLGDTYILQSVNLDNGSINNTTQRKIVAVNSDKILVESRNLDSKIGAARKLEFTPEWNLISIAYADGSQITYSPPLKYFDFSLSTGKKWIQTSIETNLKTGAVREHTISGVVEDWENVSVTAGSFHGIKVSIQTELVERLTGQKSMGKDTSWYVPEVRRSVRSLTSSRSPDGVESRQDLQLIKYELGQ